MSNTIRGTVIAKLKEEKGTSKAGKAWTKGGLVIETEGQYPKKVCFTALNAAVESIRNLAVGCIVEVEFNVESREYNGRWYTDVTAWKVTETF